MFWRRSLRTYPNLSVTKLIFRFVTDLQKHGFVMVDLVYISEPKLRDCIERVIKMKRIINATWIMFQQKKDPQVPYRSGGCWLAHHIRIKTKFLNFWKLFFFFISWFTRGTTGHISTLFIPYDNKPSSILDGYYYGLPWRTWTISSALDWMPFKYSVRTRCW